MHKQHLHHNLLTLKNMQWWKGIVLQPDCLCYSACSPASVVHKLKVNLGICTPGHCLQHLHHNLLTLATHQKNDIKTAGSASAEVLITTDACVKALEEDSSVSLSLTLLVNYDLPAKKVCTARPLSYVLFNVPIPFSYMLVMNCWVAQALQDCVTLASFEIMVCSRKVNRKPSEHKHARVVGSFCRKSFPGGYRWCARRLQKILI